MQECKTLFLLKHQDYGSAWRILRPSSLSDQLFIKAKRIRSIEEQGQQKIADSLRSEFIGLYNYSLLAIIQLEAKPDLPLNLDAATVKTLYQGTSQETENLMLRKNHDYGEAWRDMRQSSLTDLILMKLLRLKQIEDLGEQLQVSEGRKANYQDIANYAAFALIKCNENSENFV